MSRLKTGMQARLVFLVLSAVAGSAGLSAVAACGGSVSPGPSQGPVAGTVLGADGAPVASLPLVVAGTRVVTDAQGRFAVSDAPEAYDVVMQTPLPDNYYAVQGLRSRDPVVRVSWVVLPGVPRNTTAHLTELPASDRRRMFACRLVTDPKASCTMNDGVLDMYWSGDAPAAFELSVAEYTFDAASGAVTEYVAVAQEKHTFSRGEDFVWHPAFRPLAPAERHVFSVDVTVPQGSPAPGDPGYWAMLFARFSADGSLIGVPVQRSHGANVAVPLPPFEGAVFDLLVEVRSDVGISNATLLGVKPDGAAKLDLGPGVRGVSPDDNASNVTLKTPIAWSAASPAFVSILPANPSFGTPSFQVLAADGHGHLPDLSALGGVIPSGTAYDWSVSISSAWTDFDNAVEVGWAGRPAVIPDEPRGSRSQKRRFVAQ